MSLTLPDLSLESSLTIYGRYQGSFPDNLKGILGDLSSFTMDLKIQRDNNIAAAQRLPFTNCSVARLSCKDEHTDLQHLPNDPSPDIKCSSGAWKKKGDPNKILDSEPPEMILLQRLSIAFVDLIATAENIPSWFEEPELPQNSNFTENGSN
ncbi:hypothetical protein Gotur_023306 [Gossypium turneri]